MSRTGVKSGNTMDYALTDELIEQIEYFVKVCSKFYEENWHYPSAEVVELITGQSANKIKRVYADWHSFIKIEFNLLNGTRKVVCASYELRKDKNQKDWDFLGTANDLQGEIESKYSPAIYVNHTVCGYHVTRHIDTYNNIPLSQYRKD